MLGNRRDQPGEKGGRAGGARLRRRARMKRQLACGTSQKTPAVARRAGGACWPPVALAPPVVAAACSTCASGDSGAGAGGSAGATAGTIAGALTSGGGKSTRDGRDGEGIGAMATHKVGADRSGICA